MNKRRTARSQRTTPFPIPRAFLLWLTKENKKTSKNLDELNKRKQSAPPHPLKSVMYRVLQAEK